MISRVSFLVILYLYSISFDFLYSFNYKFLSFLLCLLFISFYICLGSLICIICDQFKIRSKI